MARSKPFSGKQKKDQLKEKKERKRIENAILDNNLDISIQEKRKMAREILKGNINNSVNNNDHILSSKIILTKNKNDENNEDYENSDDTESEEEVEKALNHIKEINTQMAKFDNNNKNNNNNNNNRDNGRRMNKLVTIFEKESKEEIELRKQNSKKPLDTTFREKPWLIMNEYDKENQIDNNNFIDIPKRPKWSYSMSADRLKQEERSMFSNWLSDIVKNYDKKRLNYFENNLEVWRQLWRVSERSDVILLITDARYPLFHFPPSLYNYIHEELKKPMILVLNKTDLVNKRIIEAWINYFTKNYPSLKVICFSSFASFEDESEIDFEDATKKRKMKKGRKRYDLSKGKQNLIEAIKSLSTLGNKANLITGEDLEEKTKEKENNVSEDDFSEEEDDTEDDTQDDENSYEDDYDSYYSDYCNNEKKQQHPQDKQQLDFVTIGMVGHPNVGKSSLINGLMGKKVVSTSRTPGHTKHFQTIVFSKNIQLLDCPGLVFPALDRPKQLQILCGLFPIAQVREPFSAIQYLAERVPVEKIYRLKNPNEEDNEPWSAYSICEAFALKRGYLVAKSGRPDPHRAGLELLKDCVDGNIVISWPPPGFTKDEYIQLLSNHSNDGDNSNEANYHNKDDSSNGPPATKAFLKYNKKLKKKNMLNKIAYSDESEDEEIDSDPSIEEQFVKSPKQTAFMALDSISTDENEDTSDLDESDDYSEKEKNNKKTTTKKTTTTNTTTTSKSTSAPKTNKKKKKGNIKHESEYQERLKEKQNKGGNRRQLI
ncbi:hypothetical protein DICPUDRAFT_148454 [Dictyostelium purpureum]|uniref:Guanine nucleotide-binding protein-like 1 n=1 Tax=Dictyostelium purpureum TaxID=5786 RepID=F0ZB63_DICPU|nr:uncharacterized protein DICPUDRAFT_148454 [Dictyostelium purpureum]EGC38867.1 hypothetical protein DICPUDRAFT_148454 [Dictyostelium purpureum]|eukprot:XP_003284661.1 hypothetical protein DICPUDRAFT_148454 [Dictyostelium purpureum]